MYKTFGFAVAVCLISLSFKSMSFICLCPDAYHTFLPLKGVILETDPQIF